MEYFEFIEDYHKKQTISKFERVLVASKRAKDIIEGKRTLVAKKEGHKAISLAQYEVNNNLIDHVIKDPEELVVDEFEEGNE